MGRLRTLQFDCQATASHVPQIFDRPCPMRCLSTTQSQSPCPYPRSPSQHVLETFSRQKTTCTPWFIPFQFNTLDPIAEHTPRTSSAPPSPAPKHLRTTTGQSRSPLRSTFRPTHPLLLHPTHQNSTLTQYSRLDPSTHTNTSIQTYTLRPPNLFPLPFHVKISSGREHQLGQTVAFVR
jgi:hypothetical protein